MAEAVIVVFFPAVLALSSGERGKSILVMLLGALNSFLCIQRVLGVSYLVLAVHSHSEAQKIDP